MKFKSYLEEKMNFIIMQISFIFLLDLLLFLLRINGGLVFIVSVVIFVYNFSYLLISYFSIKRKCLKIRDLVDNLEEKYLISEILIKPKEILNQAYYDALKQACKAMNDKISNLEMERQDYQEYVESFAHEIKNPIAVLALALDNSKSKDLLEEVEKIKMKVEQMLYYARSEAPEKDYFVKELCIKDLLHPIILNYKNTFLKKKVILNIDDLDYKVYTDEKWLTFIISQVFENSLKYLDKEEKFIDIKVEEHKNNLVLLIKDNGVGIKESDLKRVFEKGFTGNNRKKEYSTGIGLYLAKKLCDRLNLKLEINSIYLKYTIVKITFPKTNIYKMN